MVIIQLISSKTGNPVSGKRVVIVGRAVFNCFVTKVKSSNAQGKVEFTKVIPCPDGEIYVNGRSVHKGKIKGFNQIEF